MLIESLTQFRDFLDHSQPFQFFIVENQPELTPEKINGIKDNLSTIKSVLQNAIIKEEVHFLKQYAKLCFTDGSVFKNTNGITSTDYINKADKIVLQNPNVGNKEKLFVQNIKEVQTYFFKAKMLMPHPAKTLEIETSEDSFNSLKELISNPKEKMMGILHKKCIEKNDNVKNLLDNKWKSKDQALLEIYENILKT